MIGIANGPVGLVLLYEDDVQQRVVELGLTTKAKIRRSFLLCSTAMFVPLFVLPPLMVYGINGATGFWDGFWQMAVILWMQGLFDRFFIDWYWVGKTKAWNIPGTEDLKPYIPVKTMVVKWISTVFLNPLIAAIVYQCTEAINNRIANQPWDRSHGCSFIQYSRLLHLRSLFQDALSSVQSLSLFVVMSDIT